MGVKMSLEVISASQLPKCQSDNSESKVVNPFVIIELFGYFSEKMKKRTKTIVGNGFNPVWQQEFTFEISAKHIDTTMILFRVFSDNFLKGKNLLASNSFPLQYVKTGYRFVPL